MSGAALRRRATVLGALAFAVVAGVVDASGGRAPEQLAGGEAVTPGRAHALVGTAVRRELGRRAQVPVLVTLRDAARLTRGAAPNPRAVASARRRALAGSEVEDIRLGMAYTNVPAFSAVVTREGLAELAASPDVLAIDLPVKHRPLLSEGVALIRANQVHAQGISGAGVTVAVVDTGIDATHPDLADDVVGEACFVREADGDGACPDGSRRQLGPGSAHDGGGHGTAVAGVVTSRGVVASRGVAPDADVLAIKVFADEPDTTADSRDTLAALDWLVTSRPDVRVVNLSLGGDPVDAPCDTTSAVGTAYASAFAALRARGVTVVAASGNEGSRTGISAPACASGAISVGAVYDANLGPYATADCTDSTTAADKVACYSNGGQGLDLLAPGPGTVTPHAGGGTEDFGGTSAAAPFVAGAAALLLQARPALGPDGVETALRQSGVPVLDERTGRTTPRIDVAAALALLPSLADASARTVLDAGALAFTDVSGDGTTGPDIGAVRVESSGTGLLTFSVATPNRPTLGSSESVQILVDADRDAATGSAGADYALVVLSSREAELHRWSGSWQFAGFLGNGAYANGSATVSIDQAAIGARGDVSFRVASLAGRRVIDTAPAAGAWPFPAHVLTVSRAGTGAGTVTGGGPGAIDCGSHCSAPLARGTTVTLAASATPGSVFVGWGGACAGAGPCTVGMDASKELTARFETLRRLTVSRTGRGGGTVRSAGVDCGTTCAVEHPHGTTITLEAVPDPGSAFAGWSGACTGTAACTLALTTASGVTAAFNDVRAPVATVLGGSGRRGGSARVDYHLDDNSGFAGAVLTVRAHGRRLFRRTREATVTGAASLTWRVPARVRRPVSFCVAPVDQSGNRGRTRCARLTLR